MSQSRVAHYPTPPRAKAGILELEGFRAAARARGGVSRSRMRRWRALRGGDAAT